MINKISATLCDIPLNIFLPKGFFDFSTSPSHLHKHCYTEIHIIGEGHVIYDVGSKQHKLSKGDFLIIPPHKIHACISSSDDAKHCAFFIDKAIDSVVCDTISETLANELMLDIPDARQKENYFSLTGYFSLILSKVITDSKILPIEMKDDSFIIDNYIERHYANSPSLGELAKRLRRSEKQAARLVKSYHGASFSELIIHKRMRTAEFLERTTDMTLKEISEYVGYSSYSGFYKSYTRFLKTSKLEKSE